MKEGEVEIEIPSSYDNLVVIRDIVRTFLESEKIAKLDRVQLISVVDELATNVVEHAYEGLGETEKKIKIYLKYENNIVKIIIEDFGIGLDNSKKSKEEGGLGLNIVKGIVDEFKVAAKDRGIKIDVSKKVKKEEK